MRRHLVVLYILLASAGISFAQATGGQGVPGAATSGLPVATGAGQVPTSTGPGTTYTAQTPTGTGTVNSATAFSPTYYTATGTTVGGVTPFVGLAWYTTSAAPAAASSANLQSVIGSGVYDASGAAATAQSNAESFTSTSYAPLASPALSGTPTAPTVAVSSNNTGLATTAAVLAAIGTSKYVAGIGYTNLYSGSTLDVRVNACMTDAIALTNGNTTGICSSSNEPASQTVAATITIGNSAGATVEWILPENAAWSCTVTSGPCIQHWGGGMIQNVNPICAQTQACVMTLAVGATPTYLYATLPTSGSGNNYYYFDGFSFINTAQATSTGIGVYLGGTARTYDVSTWSHLNVGDQKDTYGTKVYNLCCSAKITTSTFNGGYAAGQTPLYFLSDSSAATIAFTLEDSTIGHPGSGEPILLISDTGSHVSTYNLKNIYNETSNSDTTTALWQISGAGAVNMDSINWRAEVATDSAVSVSVANVGTTTIHATGLSRTNGAGNFSGQNMITNNILSTTVAGDSIGNLACYDSTATAAVVCPSVSTTPWAIYGTGQVASFGNSATATYTSFSGARGIAGFDGNNAFLQGASGKGVAFYANNGTAGSGLVGKFDSSGNFGVGTNTTVTSDTWYVTAAGAEHATTINVATARKGTFVCTSGGTITISNANEAITSDVVISLNTAGGTVSTAPAMKTATAGTGFTVLCATSDTSTYNYDILN